MEFYVNPYDGVPVYLQIVQQVKAAVSLGTLRAGDRLPTVRELAGHLAINPNTVAKAYRELEASGTVTTASVRGTFVCEQPTTSTDTTRLDKLIDMIIIEMHNAGLAAGDVAQRFLKRAGGGTRGGGRK